MATYKDMINKVNEGYALRDQEFSKAKKDPEGYWAKFRKDVLGGRGGEPQMKKYPHGGMHYFPKKKGSQTILDPSEDRFFDIDRGHGGWSEQLAEEYRRLNNSRLKKQSTPDHPFSRPKKQSTPAPAHPSLDYQDYLDRLQQSRGQMNYGSGYNPYTPYNSQQSPYYV